ncbi:hypothetical protein [Marinicauda sp. Alg238-R41]|uniref:hypothetical protein n=1 Tax=Marinicauda sp. Alg238-R41 TaxID=2993447 RepID=UPI0022E7AE1B|nr:hypothetical protein [Marinicauda sp. Alg238-R41]
MTDGPHRSLPQSQAWKCTAEALAKPAFTQEEANERACKALRQDFRRDDGRRLLRLAAKLVQDGPQPSLFSGKEHLIEALRDRARPNQLTECFIRHFRRQPTIERALTATLKESMAPSMRGIEDHYHQAIEKRETTPRAVDFLQSRCRTAQQQIDFKAEARRLLKPERSSSRRGDTSIDRLKEGPALP